MLLTGLSGLCENPLPPAKTANKNFEHAQLDLGNVCNVISSDNRETFSEKQTIADKLLLLL